ncbi:TIGR00730 family Rossman fold protein [Candidatus Woesearchaeota archaeon]|nr:TIGR00730 family Rossman fold protein [Candidatus Woesearchaeota archaeon]
MSTFRKNREYFDQQWTAEKVKEEIENGLSLLKSINYKIITVFGSARPTPKDKVYLHCENVAHTLGKKGYALISGGGPGIMHATNSGAMRAKVPSIGMRATLLTAERIHDPIFTHDLQFHFLFVRRFLMSIKSEALIFYPGGYGTLNELFEYAVLMQTGVVDTVPIICVDKEYWQGLLKWLEDSTLKQKFLDITDLHLLTFADTAEEIIAEIEKGNHD